MMYEGVLTHPRNIFPQKKFAQSLAIQQEHRNFAADKPKREGRLAQLNRVSDYGSEGYRFESCGGHEKTPMPKALGSFYFNPLAA